MNDWLLLDTNVISFFLKGDTRARQFEGIIQGKLLALSFMSEAELYRWSIVRNWGEKKIERLEKAIERFALLPYDRELGKAWARVMSACSEKGLTIAPSDAWISATACRYDLPLLTHNLKHFEAAEKLCGLRLIRTRIEDGRL